jgi:hypothetical protein
MLDDRHIDEIAHVNFVNVAAIAVSFADFEQWLRVLLLLASLVYTVMKIIDWVKNRAK